MKQQLQRSIALAIALTLSAVSASTTAQVFECKDKNGRKIFSQSCPDQSKQVREIAVVPFKPPVPSKDKKASNWRQANIGFKDRQQAKTDAENAERDKQRALDEQCYQNQKRLLELSSGLPLIDGKDNQGQPILMDDGKRLAELKEKTEQTKHCKNTP